MNLIEKVRVVVGGLALVGAAVGFTYHHGREGEYIKDVQAVEEVMTPLEEVTKSWESSYLFYKGMGFVCFNMDVNHEKLLTKDGRKHCHKIMDSYERGQETYDNLNERLNGYNPIWANADAKRKEHHNLALGMGGGGSILGAACLVPLIAYLKLPRRKKKPTQREIEYAQNEMARERAVNRMLEKQQRQAEVEEE